MISGRKYLMGHGAGEVVRALLLGALWWAAVVGFSNRDLQAQGTGAAIQGTVSDGTGAVIPGATITATNYGNQSSVNGNQQQCRTLRRPELASGEVPRSGIHGGFPD